MKRTIIIVVAALVFCSSSIAQDKLGLYTPTEWQHKIDSTWGEGLPVETKLKIIDDFWKTIDEEYPSFHNINVNWDSLRNIFRPEIEAGVSRGRLYAIMSQLFFSLRDFHTRMVDIDIARSELKYGTPLLVPWGYWDVGHFGAALAPTEDSCLFVYSVAENHPLNLEVGDIVLGYNGILWKNLYQQMYEIQFPLAASMNLPFKKAVWGTTPSAYNHIWLCSAGMNWHLFDTIDVIKYTTKDTLHLSTKLLENQNMELIATGQIPIAGVPMPDIYNGHSISYGIIEGTKIGYIYNYGWHPDVWKFSPGDEFKNALNDLINNYEIKSLIIDARITDGGSPEEVRKIYPLLFKGTWDAIKNYVRSDPNNHFLMKPSPSNNLDDFRLTYKSENDFFDRPIAVLTGPVAQSMGDIVPLIFKSHPYARLFGLPTNGAFGYVNPNFNKLYGGEAWEEWITLTDMKFKNSHEEYLTHVGYSIDDTLWLDLEDVVKGEDSVVKKALGWLTNLVYSHSVTVNNTYLKPNNSLIIKTNLVNPNEHSVSVLAYISIDSMLVDSVNLAKEVSQSENIWSTSWLPTQENTYQISVKTVDITDSTSRILPNVVSFTTAGPITIDSISTLRQSLIDPTRFAFDVYLKNNGVKVTVNDISATIIPDTSVNCFTKAGIYYKSFGDIEPGEVKKGRNFIVYLDSTCINTNFSIPFSLDISSNGYSFWSDSSSLYIVTGVTELKNTMPTKFALYQNYPNPFNPSTTIKYSIPSSVITRSEATWQSHSEITSSSQQDGIPRIDEVNVTLKVYNILGREVATLVNQKQKPGNYEVTWKASNQPSGVYFYQLTAGEFVETKKMILLR